MIKTWKKVLDRKRYGGAVIIDLSKVFHTINDHLLLAKLQANRWQRTNANASFSSWYILLIGVTQGFVLGPLLFNIYLNDLFHLMKCTNVSSYADDTTFHVCDSDLKDLITRLEQDSLLAIEWFQAN